MMAKLLLALLVVVFLSQSATAGHSLSLVSILFSVSMLTVRICGGGLLDDTVYITYAVWPGLSCASSFGVAYSVTFPENSCAAISVPISSPVVTYWTEVLNLRRRFVLPPTDIIFTDIILIMYARLTA